MVDYGPQDLKALVPRELNIPSCHNLLIMPLIHNFRFINFNELNKKKSIQNHCLTFKALAPTLKDKVIVSLTSFLCELVK
jgi:hypothetical protein